MTSDPGELAVQFLEDGKQVPETVAQELTAFFAAARRSLDIAIYDPALGAALTQTVAGAPVAAVWTGSTNWTDDAWGREENAENLLSFTSRPLADLFTAFIDRVAARYSR